MICALAGQTAQNSVCGAQLLRVRSIMFSRAITFCFMAGAFTAMLTLALSVGPAIAQKTSPPPLIAQIRPGVTYEDCVERCKKCGSGRNPHCIKYFCTGYPHRKPGVPPLPVVCPQYS